MLSNACEGVLAGKTPNNSKHENAAVHSLYVRFHRRPKSVADIEKLLTSEGCE